LIELKEILESHLINIISFIAIVHTGYQIHILGKQLAIQQFSVTHHLFINHSHMHHGIDPHPGIAISQCLVFFRKLVIGASTKQITIIFGQPFVIII